MTSINSSQPLRVYGYHGTSQKSAQKIIEHGFDVSTNDYVRAVFNEGNRIYPNSAIFDRAHVQISIRNLALIEESCLIEIE